MCETLSSYDIWLQSYDPDKRSGYLNQFLLFNPPGGSKNQNILKIKKPTDIRILSQCTNHYAHLIFGFRVMVRIKTQVVLGQIFPC